MASVYSIVFLPPDKQYTDPKIDYIREPLSQANLVAGHGIEGDQKAGHHPDRQLNLISKEWLDEQCLKGYKTEPGQFGEQIIISGLAVQDLKPGTRLQLGSEAWLEVVKPRTGCIRFEAAQGKPVEGLGTLGILAKVTVSGPVRVGDAVVVAEELSEKAH